MNMEQIIQAKVDKINADFEGKVAAIEANAAKLKSEAEVIKASDLGEVELLKSALGVFAKENQDVGYQQALDDQQIPASDKIYTEADLQAELAAKEAQVKADFLPMIDELNAKLNELQLKYQELEASIPAQVDQAIESFKAMALEAAVKLKDVQDQSEFQLLNLFKPKG